jgi:glycosyltransferase involved in cell wall biosynthesis
MNSLGDSRYDSYRHRLVHQPLRQWESDPTDVVVMHRSSALPLYTIVIPVHNQENIIQKVLTSVVDMTLGRYELIVILDGCTDGTRNEVTSWTQTCTFPDFLVRIHVFENATGIFETSCDNQGCVMSRGRYIVEIQADMILLTLGYNVLLASPMEMYPDLIGVSGRCCHRLNACAGLDEGKLGPLVSEPHKTMQNFNNYGKIYLSHTVNRGPLALRRCMLEELGFFDEAHYVLGDDDHDLFARAWVQKKWRCGFVPVEVYSPLEWGSTRKQKPLHVKQYLETREKKRSGSFLFQHLHKIEYGRPETREFRVSHALLG